MRNPILLISTQSALSRPTNNGYNLPSHQRGAALIVVLLFLVLILLAGAIAVRQSTTDLRTATADQINTLLLQSADSGNQKLEAMVNAAPVKSSSLTFAPLQPYLRMQSLR